MYCDNRRNALAFLRIRKVDMVKKIAILFSGDIRDRKGFMNAVLERTKRLCVLPQYSVDVFCLSTFDHLFARKLRHSNKIEQCNTIEVEGITINMLWIPFSILDYVLSVKLHSGKLIEPLLLRRLLPTFRNYDLISAHSVTAGMIARMVNGRYGVPYSVTWHGSDIHTEPFLNKSYRNTVCKVVKRASANLFVSKALLSTAKQLFSVLPNASVSYNGASKKFYTYTADEKASVRAKYGVNADEVVVGFVGGLVPIKNVDKLPCIFNTINSSCRKVKFWVIGDGKLRQNIEQQLHSSYADVDCVMFGNQSPKIMPELMNCIDLLVLPSQNEGLPLVIVEALSCGANVVASDVGGIKEVLGASNVVALGDNFAERFGARCSEIINGTEAIPGLATDFDWATTIERELTVYNEIMK